jgi:transposase
MIMNDKIFLGIDVSKATLDISLSGKHFKITNEKNEILAFINKELILKKIMPELVCLESTGGYEITAIQSFNMYEIPVHKAHPNRVYAFAKAYGHFAKTDKLDSKLLEKYAACMSEEEKGDVPISEATYELQELRGIERNIMNDLHANQCRIKISRGKGINHLATHIEFLQMQLLLVRKDIDKIIKSDIQLNQKRMLLVSHKGVGIQTANVLLAEIPELGELSNKQIASLIGVAPKTHESGIKKSRGHIMGGRFYVRKALYMAALVASRFNHKMKVFYERLILAGKAKKIALVAVMRKIIVCLNVMVKNNVAYNAI